MAKITKLPTPKYDGITDNRSINDNVISLIISEMQKSFAFIINPLKSIDENTLETNINLENVVKLLDPQYSNTTNTSTIPFQKSIDENTLETNINLEDVNKYLKSIDENTLETNINLENLIKKDIKDTVNQKTEKGIKKENTVKRTNELLTELVEPKQPSTYTTNDTEEKKKKPSLAGKAAKYFGLDTASPIVTDAFMLGKKLYDKRKEKKSNISVKETLKDTVSKTSNYFGVTNASPIAKDTLSFGKEKLEPLVKRIFVGVSDKQRSVKKEESITTVNENLVKLTDAVVDLKPKRDLESELEAKSKRTSFFGAPTNINSENAKPVSEGKGILSKILDKTIDKLLGKSSIGKSVTIGKAVSPTVDPKQSSPIKTTKVEPVSKNPVKTNSDKIKTFRSNQSKTLPNVKVPSGPTPIAAGANAARGGGLVGGLLGNLTGGLSNAFSTLFSPANLLKGLTKIALPAMIIGSLVSGIVDGFKKWKETGSITEALLEGVSGIVEFLSFGLISKEDFKKFANVVGGYIDEYLITPVKGMIDSVADMFKPVGDMLSNMWDSAKRMLSNIEIPKVSVFGKEFGPWKLFSDEKPKQSSEGSGKESSVSPSANKASVKVQEGNDEKLKRDWAYSVHTGKATMEQVPKQFKSDVEAMVKKPEASWGEAAQKTSGNVSAQSKESGSTEPMNSVKSENAVPVPSSPSSTNNVSVENNSTKPTLTTSNTSPGVKPSSKGSEPGLKMPSVSGGDKQIMAMIEKHEGKRYRPYKDSLGLWTVGVGHLIGDGKSLPPEWNREFSEEEVQTLFAKDYEHHKEAAMKFPGWKNLNQEGQAAMIDLTFNMGPSWYKKWPSFTKASSEGNSEQAATSLQDSKWYTQVGNRAKTIVSLIRSGFKSSGDSGGNVASTPAMQSKGIDLSENTKQSSTASKESTPNTVSSSNVKTESGNLTSGDGSNVATENSANSTSEVKPKTNSGLMFGLIKRDNGDLRKVSDTITSYSKDSSTTNNESNTVNNSKTIESTPVSQPSKSMLEYEVPKQQKMMTNAVTEMKQQVDSQAVMPVQMAQSSPIIAPSSSSSSNVSNVTNVFNAPDLDSTVRRLSDMSMFRNKVW